MSLDTFDGTGVLSGNWAVLAGAASRVSGVLVGSSFPVGALYTTGMPATADQYVEVVIASFSTGISPLVRCSPVSFNGYDVVAESGALHINRVDGGVVTLIETAATGLTFAAGDRIGILVIGSFLRAYYNGVAQGTGVTDATYSAAETPGINLVASGDTVDSWRALDAPFSTLTGTAAAGITEVNLKATDKTVVLTLTGATVIPA
jgi:hypothetical protein